MPRATCRAWSTTRAPRSRIWRVAFYERPARSLKMAGVTGTNGKTTTTFLIKHICENAGLRCGLIGTVRYEIGERVLPATRTTPESLDLQELLAQMVNAGCKAAAMEVSSHALAQDRTRGLEWDVAVFTNLTQDHLDFHGTMENYFEAKAETLHRPNESDRRRRNRPRSSTSTIATASELVERLDERFSRRHLRDGRARRFSRFELSRGICRHFVSARRARQELSRARCRSSADSMSPTRWPRSPPRTR